MSKKIKSVVVIGKSWWDRQNGNTYCSARVLVDGQVAAAARFQYGYGSYFEQAAAEALSKLPEFKDVKYPLSSYCRDKGITYHATMQEKCLQRDVKSWGQFAIKGE